MYMMADIFRITLSFRVVKSELPFGVVGIEIKFGQGRGDVAYGGEGVVAAGVAGNFLGHYAVVSVRELVNPPELAVRAGEGRGNFHLGIGVSRKCTVCTG